MSDPQQQQPAQPYGTPPQGQQPTQPYGSDPQGQPAPPYGAEPAPYPSQQQPAQPYGAPQGQSSHYAAAPHYAAASSTATGSAGAGRLAFVLALASLGLGLLTSIAYPLVFRWFYDSAAIGALGVVSNGLIFVVALAGLLLGVVAARRPGSKMLPGIAIGITGSQLAGILVSWVSNLFYALPF